MSPSIWWDRGIALRAAEALRAGGYADAITLLGDEPHGPYHRPPLSKTFLSGDKTEDELLIRSADAYAQANVTLLLGRRAVRIDRSAKQVFLDDGTVLDEVAR